MSIQARKLRRLLAENDYLVAPGAYDALSAKCIEAAGFQVAGTTGYGMHGVVLGQPDTGQLTLSETVDILTKMCNAVDIPILGEIPSKKKGDDRKIVAVDRNRDPISDVGIVTGLAGAGEKKPIAALRYLRE